MSKKEEKYYWHGPGVALISDTRYYPGKEIPAEKVPSGRLAEWIRDGKVSTAPIPISGTSAETKKDARIRELEEEIAKLRNEKGKGGKCKSCAEKDKQITSLTADAEEKAALIEKQKEEITLLNALLEKKEGEA